MYGSRAVTPLVLISDDVINRILKLDIQTYILVYVIRCCTDLTSKVLKERTFGQSSAVLRSLRYEAAQIWNCLPNELRLAESFPQSKRLFHHGTVTFADVLQVKI